MWNSNSMIVDFTKTTSSKSITHETDSTLLLTHSKLTHPYLNFYLRFNSSRLIRKSDLLSWRGNLAFEWFYNIKRSKIEDLAFMINLMPSMSFICLPQNHYNQALYSPRKPSRYLPRVPCPTISFPPFSNNNFYFFSNHANLHYHSFFLSFSKASCCNEWEVSFWLLARTCSKFNYSELM